MEFRQVYGFPGYSVSKTGVVKSGWKEMSLCKHPRGYLQVTLRSGRKTYHKLVHRLVLETWDKPNPDGCVCHHKNGDKTDNRLENLEWVSQKVNVWEGIDVIPIKKCLVCQREFKPSRRVQVTCSRTCAGGLRSGEKSHRARFTEEDIRNIRRRRNQGESGVSLAREFDTKPSTICDIVKRRCWKHIY